MEQPISPEDFKAWEEHPITQALKQRCHRAVDDACEGWLSNPSPDPQAASYARGYACALRDVAKVTREELEV